MRIAVLGAGGVGGFFGAKLALAGNEVTFIARGRHRAAIEAHGLQIESGTGNLRVSDAKVTDRPETVTGADVVMFCVKLWDVESAAQQVRPMIGDRGVVIPFQNGVEAHTVLARVIGPAQTLGGVAYIAAMIKAPGVIAHTGTMASLRIGAFSGGPTAKAEAFVQACQAAGIDAAQSPDIERALWEKFVFLSAMSGCTAVARQPAGVIRADPDLRETFVAAMEEAIALGTARGVHFPEGFAARQLTFLDGLPAAMRSSLQNDLISGHRLEAPWLCGAVARMSTAAGLPAPVNSTIYAALKPYCDGAPTPH